MRNVLSMSFKFSTFKLKSKNIVYWDNDINLCVFLVFFMTSSKIVCIHNSLTSISTRKICLQYFLEDFFFRCYMVTSEVEIFDYIIIILSNPLKNWDIHWLTNLNNHLHKNNCYMTTYINYSQSHSVSRNIFFEIFLKFGSQ